NKWIFYPKTKKYTNLLGHELLYSYKFYYKKIVSASGFWLHKKSNKWLNKKNEDVFDFADNELRFTLNKKYGLKLPNKNSTISNGGVFGFTPKHKLFFNDWKNLCLQQFNDPDFRTRDQTALFVAQQKHKAQN